MTERKGIEPSSVHRQCTCLTRCITLREWGDVRESNSRYEVHSLVCDRYTNATVNWSATEESNLDLPLIGQGPCRWTSGG